MLTKNQWRHRESQGHNKTRQGSLLLFMFQYMHRWWPRLPTHTLPNQLILRTYPQTSSISTTKSQNLNVSRLVWQNFAFAQSIEARRWVENEDVVGAAPTGGAPTTSEWSTNVLPTKVRLILEFWRYTARYPHQFVSAFGCVATGAQKCTWVIIESQKQIES